MQGAELDDFFANRCGGGLVRKEQVVQFLAEDDILLRFRKAGGEKDVCAECGEELIQLGGVGRGEGWKFG